MRSGISISRVLQIALMPGSRSVNYTIGAVRSLGSARENPERVIPRVKDGSSVVGRTNYFTDRYEIAIPRARAFLLYSIHIKNIPAVIFLHDQLKFQYM